MFKSLNGNTNVVYVHSYTRSDGTKVKAHFRSKSGQVTGEAANLNPHNQRSTIDDYSSEVEDGIVGVINKWLLNVGIYAIGDITHQDDAAALWNIASKQWVHKFT